jgi:hypothetical protein
MLPDGRYPQWEERKLARIMQGAFHRYQTVGLTDDQGQSDLGVRLRRMNRGDWNLVRRFG